MSLDNSQFAVLLRTASGKASAALSYDVATQTITPISDRFTIETGADYWAWLIDDDYSLVFDADGLLVGDFKQGIICNDYPRLDFYFRPAGSRAMGQIASLTKGGQLYALNLTGTDTLPGTGMVINGQIEFNPQGVFATKLGEMWLLTSGGTYLTYNNLLLRVR